MLPISSQSSLSSYSKLYDLIVPKDNVLRQINDLIDFSFIYEELESKYCLDNGRLAQSPIRLFKYLSCCTKFVAAHAANLAFILLTLIIANALDPVLDHAMPFFFCLWATTKSFAFSPRPLPIVLFASFLKP